MAENHPGRNFSQYQISDAYGKAATLAIAESSFCNTGLWPVNPDIFPDHLFEPAETANIPLLLEDEPQTIPVCHTGISLQPINEVRDSVHPGTSMHRDNSLFHDRSMQTFGDEDDFQNEDRHTQENHQKSLLSVLEDDDGANNDSQPTPPTHVSVATISPLPEATRSGQK
ncbi:hypothetical protein PR048_031902 [Dryococelus australis]|uniref:Uncharacterized protein n=1 Tax=Dryococelus australis TaxID=614101 RepID=A0ABQ9G9H9_9NEOP|nr:hypothetical protein PR048_031902 [Dryococelus australis]